MNKYIIKYFQILLTAFIITLCLFIIYLPMWLGCSNIIFNIMYSIITISLMMTILEYYIDKIS